MTKDEMIKEAKNQLAKFEKEMDELKEASSELSSEAKKQFDVGAEELKKLYMDKVK